LTKKPTMRIKVPFWQGKWEGVEIYDTDRNCLFPSADPNVSPMEIITKLSHMKTMIQWRNLVCKRKVWNHLALCAGNDSTSSFNAWKVSFVPHFI
jgi:hypothetical protein